ncbi:MAG TPA: peptidase, partial [Nitrosopumilaceae archaeon]
LINLVPHLSGLDFEDNGKLTMTLGNIAKLKTNDHQPNLSVSDTVNTFSQIVTLVESEPNSGTFESFDSSNESTIGILGNAPRGESAIIQYDDKSTSILAGPSTASISMNPQGSQFNAGQEAQVTVIDNDQNVNSGSRDILNVFRSTAIIPSLQLGDPVTLEKTSSLKFYSDSTDNLSGGTLLDFSVPDKNSDRLIINTASVIGTPDFEMISLNMGITASKLQSLFIDDNFGTNWINFDLKSLEQQLGISSFSDTSMSLHFGGLPGTTIIQILDPGDISSGRGFIQLDLNMALINSIPSSSPVFLVINFDSSDNTNPAGEIANETDSQPIVIDFFSFGTKNNQEINNAIYRFELEETANNSGIFIGTIEYAITNQVNVFDPSLITSLRTIDDRIKFLVTNRLLDEEGINIAYSDIAEVGVTISTSSKSDILTHSGTVSLTSTTFRFGQPVFFVLTDADLNVKHDSIETYLTVNDPNSPNVDTVGTSGGDILLEILIKDIRYKRCTVNGVQYGGLASTGFTLTETGPNTGIFQGSFKMPSQICDKTGTKLISTAGGSLDAKYHDFRDISGEQNIFGLSSFGSTSTMDNSPKLSSQKLILPKYKQTTEVTLSGKIDNYIQGTSLDITLAGPDQSLKKFNVVATQKGEYKAVLTLHDYSLPGNYNVSVNYRGSHIGDTSFQVSKYQVPDWIKNNAKWWASNQISDSDFIKGIEHLIQENIIIIPDSVKSENNGQNIPTWIKKTAEWWSSDIVSDDEFMSTLEFLVKNGIIRI